MNEAFKNSDRMHAISFGEFYLNAFSERTNWEELKEVFQHWNMDKNSSFASQSAKDFDPQFFEKVIETFKILSQLEKFKTK